VKEMCVSIFQMRFTCGDHVSCCLLRLDTSYWMVDPVCKWTKLSDI